MGCISFKSSKVVEPLRSELQPLPQPLPYSYDQVQNQHNYIAHPQYATDPNQGQYYSYQNPNAYK